MQKPLITLFPIEENEWQYEWKGMPEYNNVEEEAPVIMATFKFRNEEDFILFNQKIKKYLYKGKKMPLG